MRLRVLSVLALVLPSPSRLWPAIPESFTIQVQASGMVMVAPTKAQLWVGAKVDGETAEEALNSSNEVMGRLVEVLSQYTSPDLVKTSEFSMYQNETWDDETGQFIRSLLRTPRL